MVMSSANGKNFFDKIELFDFVTQIFSFTVVPGLIGFYSFYSYLFPDFLRKKEDRTAFHSWYFHFVVDRNFWIICYAGCF